MTATTFQRVGVLRALRDRLRAAEDLTGIPVLIGPPHANEAGMRHVWLAVGEGSLAVAGMKLGRKTRDDTFQINVWCVVYFDGDPDGEMAAETAETLAGVVDGVIADDVGLTGEGLDHVLVVTVIEANGPTPVPTETGHAAAVHLVIEAKVRMT